MMVEGDQERFGSGDEAEGDEAAAFVPAAPLYENEGLHRHVKCDNGSMYVPIGSMCIERQKKSQSVHQLFADVCHTHANW